jgi:hypothetical protein
MKGFLIALTLSVFACGGPPEQSQRADVPATLSTSGSSAATAGDHPSSGETCQNIYTSCLANCSGDNTCECACRNRLSECGGAHGVLELCSE